ncbi:RNA 2',3'-cyclic phosphodiesterase [Acrocarpospora catenulata]|uniref:RNA 2',3'-cyclic phosphodiesterase n=1 Tax=Acrocarpospora catenulata TaxID=2836182 RepID=UPI001BDA464B|nr:RNA 2',3'-cyclic phosphodiesterase [Acrocarpospora catenulata]
MRLFVAVLPPPAVLAEVDRAVAPLRRERPELTWEDPERWHITLAFLGEVPEAAVPGLDARLRAAAWHEPFPLALDGAGHFASKVMWLGVRAPDGGLAELAASVVAGAREEGVQLEDRPYLPHLTLARSRKACRLPLRTLRHFDGTPWRVATAHLVRSHQGQTVRYEPISAYPLGLPG